VDCVLTPQCCPSAYASLALAGPGSLRVGSKVISDALIEASFIDAPALSRLISETSMWYDTKGKN